jgi:hypothetical protein
MKGDNQFKPKRQKEAKTKCNRGMTDLSMCSGVAAVVGGAVVGD